MNTAQIAYALEQDPVASKEFLECFRAINDRQVPLWIRHQHRPKHKAGNALDLYLPLVSPKGSWFDSYCMPLEFYGTAFMDLLAKHVTIGILRTVNCKAIGPTYAVNIVYSL